MLTGDKNQIVEENQLGDFKRFRAGGVGLGFYFLFFIKVETLHSPTTSPNCIQKGRDFIKHGEFFSKGRNPSKNRDARWMSILAKIEQLLSLCKERCPIYYIIIYLQLKTFSRDHYRRQRPPYTSLLIYSFSS